MEIHLCRGAAIAVVLTLAACGGGPTLYQQEVDGYGYSQQQIEGNRYRVVFSGNSSTQRGTVENYVRFRAAEIALA
ncbi:MAG: hypothetical protein FJX53_05360 [Alphaproteobacteria bacterium]|nr:hypothetical protein [Alphaproteobacteria bacterium]